MADLRIGIIGCGGISKTHCQGWQKCDGVVLAACCDIQRSRAEQRSQEFGIPAVYDDWTPMLRREELDLVSVCTWPGTHAAATIAAIEAGAKGVLCEKPMARSLAECDAMIAAADQHGAKLAIGHHQRFVAANTLARRHIAEGAIGQVVQVQARAEGGLGNNGSHQVDRARYWLGDAPVAWVMGQTERHTNRYERLEPIEDRTGAIICFENGARLSLEVDLPKTDMPEASFIYGTEGALKVADRGRLYRLGGDGWQPLDLPTDATQYQELLDWMAGGPMHRNAAAITRGTIEVLMAIYESVRTRGLVKLPLANAENPLVQLIDEGRLPLDEPERYDIRVPYWKDL